MKTSWIYLLIDVHGSHNAKYFLFLESQISELLADTIIPIEMTPKLLSLENSIISNML